MERRNDFAQNEVFDLDDHKDAFRDAEHALRHGTEDAAFRNLARCYLQLRRHRRALCDDIARKSSAIKAEHDPAGAYVADTLDQIEYELRRFHP